MRTLMFIATAAVFSVPAHAQTIYPLTVENCGETITIPQAPERVVTIKSTATELLLSLGLGDKIVGVGFQDAPLPAHLSGTQLNVLADALPSQEVVLEVEPDFIYGGWESNFTADGAGERSTLTKLGVASYVAPAACRSIAPPKLTFDDLFAEITEMGSIFNAASAANALIAEQKSTLASITPDTRGLTAVWYSSAIKTPYVGAGNNAPAMMMEVLGLTNVFADIPEGWTSVSWEAVADANPGIIILVETPWNTAEQKRSLLAENPVTKEMDAVKNTRYLTLPFPAAEAGVRTIPAIVDLSKQLSNLNIP